jgi:hypothetical protein
MSSSWIDCRFNAAALYAAALSPWERRLADARSIRHRRLGALIGPLGSSSFRIRSMGAVLAGDRSIIVIVSPDASHLAARASGASPPDATGVKKTATAPARRRLEIGQGTRGPLCARRQKVETGWNGAC